MDNINLDNGTNLNKTFPLSSLGDVTKDLFARGRAQVSRAEIGALFLRLIEAVTASITSAINGVTGVTAATIITTIAIPAGSLLTHITFIKTDSVVNPTLNIKIQGGATLVPTVNFDEADSTVWGASYLRKVATVLEITTTCNTTFKYYIQ